MNQYKILFFTFIAFFSASISMAQLKMPRPSPASELKQQIGLTDVTINYSRPSVIGGNNDRSGQIWGTQVAFGYTPPGSFGNQNAKPWRAGANENTIISFSDDLYVEGELIKAGSYGLHMVPYKNGKVTLIFSNNTTSWGSFFYDETEDALRVEVEMKDALFTNVLTYEFVSFQPLQGTLALLWDDKMIPIEITSTHEMIVDNFKDQLRGTAGFNWQGKLAAANYCLNNNVALDQALVWSDQAIAAAKNGQTLGLKSAILFRKGAKEEAVKIVKEAEGIATKNELNLLAYQLLTAGELKMAADFFKLNIKRNPKDPNMYDSMGECYVAMGKKDDAIKMFKKCLSMNPPQFVKANSEANLKRLGADI
jgi:tetratricopeptide (TPR) repeat protein